MARISPKVRTAATTIAAMAAAAGAVVDVILPHDLFGSGPLLTALAGVGILAAVRFLANVRLLGSTHHLPAPLIAASLIALIVRYRFHTDKTLAQDMMLILVSPLAYSSIVFALSPVALFVVQILTISMTWRVGRASNTMLNAPIILTRYLGLSTCLALLYFAAFKVGPPAQFCAMISRDFPAPPLLSLERIRGMPDLAESLPYDVVTSSDGHSLVVSLKQTNGEPGGLVKIALDTGDIISVQKTAGLSPGTNSFPERIAASRQRREIYALVYGPGHYRLLAFSDEPDRLRLSRTISLPAEPVSLLVDEERQQLWIGFVGEYKGGATVAYDLQGLQPVASTESLGSTQYMATVDGTNQLLITTIHPRFKIAVLDRDHAQPTRSWQYSWPLFGLTLTKDMQYAVASSPLTRSLVFFDRGTGQVSNELAISGGLADLDHDPELPLVFVGHYSGDLNVVDTEAMRIVATYNIGYLLRGIFFDADRRQLYASSGCGVFAFDPTRRAQPGTALRPPPT